MQNLGFVTRSNPTFGNIQNTPVSDTLILLENFSDELDENPNSINIDRLPARIRLAVLKGFGESGQARGAGLKSALPFMARRIGSLAALGELDGDDLEKRRHEVFIQWLMNWLESYRLLYQQTAHSVAFAELHIESVINTFESAIETLEQEAQDDPFTDAADPRGVRAIRQYKKEAEQFRDNELPSFRKKLEQQSLPPREQLEQIRDTVNRKTSRFENLKQFVIDKSKKAAQTGLKVSGALAAESFDYAARTIGNLKSRYREVFPGREREGDKQDYSNN